MMEGGDYADMMMYDDGYQDADFALEDNGLHITAFGAQDNPAQDKYTIARGWRNLPFPKRSGCCATVTRLSNKRRC